MSQITTHVLDLAAGRPGVGIAVVLERKTDADGWQTVGEGMTNEDGRVNDLLPANDALPNAHYRLTFDTGAYFAEQNAEAFFAQVTISFLIKDATQHYHVPLLLSPYGYTTYRGS
jgi:5-hydroxyisourate hydrolase